MYRILLVDDEEAIREELGIFLERKHFEVVKGVNGLDGFALFERVRPDLVITDYRMPQLNGIELIQKMKAAAPAIPIVMLSGQADRNVCAQSLRNQAYAFLEKPVDLKELYAVIQEALAAHPKTAPRPAISGG